MVSDDELAFSIPAGAAYRLNSEREAPARPSRNTSGPSFSWSPAHPGNNIIGSASSDAGFLMYHVGNTLVFFDQKGSEPSSSDLLQLRDIVTCHDMHWMTSSSGAANGSGGSVLEVLIGLKSGEVLLWHPMLRKEPSRGLVPAITGGGEGSVLCVKWRPKAEGSKAVVSAVCLAVAGRGGRLALYGRRVLETPPPSPSRRGVVRASSARREGNRCLFVSLGVLHVSDSGGTITAIAFSPNGEMVAAVTSDGILAVYALLPTRGRDFHANDAGADALGAMGARIGAVPLSKCSSSQSSVAGPTGAAATQESAVSGASGGATNDLASGSTDQVSDNAKLVFRLRSYFGGLLCVAWSADSRCIVCGGEDDLISVVSTASGEIVARAQGHRSWVLNLAFQPTPMAKSSVSHDAASTSLMSPRVPPRSYAFASVGADGLIAFWEYTPPHGGSFYLPGDEGPSYKALGGQATSARVLGRPKSHSSLPITPSPSFRALPLLSPLVLKPVHHQPVSGLLYGRSVVLTACMGGHIKTFSKV